MIYFDYFNLNYNLAEQSFDVINIHLYTNFKEVRLKIKRPDNFSFFTL